MSLRYKPDLPRPSWGWQDRASCRGESLSLFFAADGERQRDREVRERKAKQVCMGCPVRISCADYAISRPEKEGVWGGMNPEERTSEHRRRIRRGRAAA